MIEFVNAKINIGLQIVGRRPDGYHDLQTLFYPVGLYAGTPGNPVQFCDIIEAVRCDDASAARFSVKFSGRAIDCPEEKNLIVRAARLYFDRFAGEGFKASLIAEKHLPDGAGMGGGSADAAFTMLLLARLDHGDKWVDENREKLAEALLTLGADCPFFAYNRPMYAAGVGERLEPICLPLAGKWLVAAKPDLYISTRDAFAGVRPRPAGFDLRELPSLPIEEWGEVAINDFELSLFPRYPILEEIKGDLSELGALYSSLTGSGCVVYGIFDSREKAGRAAAILRQKPTMEHVYLLEM